MRLGRASPRGGRRAARFVVAPPGSELALGVVTLVNNGTAAIQPRARFGMAWTKGRFPSTHRLVVRVQGGEEVAFAALVDENRWQDGSRKSTASGGVVIHDTASLAAGASRTYELLARTGVQLTSGFDPWAWLAAHPNDFTVDITARSGSVTGPMGNLTFSLKTAIATTTRREVLNDTLRFVRTKVWQRITGETHLICEFHLDFWLDGAGNVLGIEWCPVLTQHWHIANPFGENQPKQRQDYTATVRYGATVLDTRTVQHAYHCRWASLRTNDDPQHARKHWVNVSGSDPIPTIRAQYPIETLREMMRAGAIPPIRQDVVPSLPGTTAVTTYAPLGSYGFNAYIINVGGSSGRGVVTVNNGALLIHQSGGGTRNPDLAWRQARVTAQAALSCYVHVADHRTVNGDVSNKVMPFAMRRIGTGTQTYPGLAPANICYNRAATGDNPAPATFLPHDAAHGGTGAFSGYGASHIPEWGLMAFLEGERYIGEAAFNVLMMNCTYGNFNAFQHNRTPWFAGSTTGDFIGTSAIASEVYGQNPILGDSWRAIAWSMNILRAAVLYTGHNDPHRPFVENIVLNCNNFFSRMYGFWPSSWRQRGTFWLGAGTTGQNSLWQGCFMIMSGYQFHRFMHDFLPVNERGFTGIQEAAHLEATGLARQADHGWYNTATYENLWSTDAAWTDPHPVDFMPRSFSCTISGNVVTLTDPPLGLPVANGDRAAFPTGSPVVGVSSTIRYWVVNASGNSFQLSETENGPPITLSLTGSASIFLKMASMLQTPMGPEGVREWAAGDSYHMIAQAAAEVAGASGHPDFGPSRIQSLRDFYAPRFAAPSPPNNPPWLLRGDLLETT